VTAGDVLASVSAESPFGKPTLDVAKSGSRADVHVSSSEGRGPFVPASQRSELDVALDRALAWRSVKVNGGFTDVGVDFTELAVADLDVNVGLSTAAITFGTNRGSAICVRNMASEIERSIDKRFTSSRSIGTSRRSTRGISTLTPDAFVSPS
jgi:hypothetical protein